MSTQSPSPHSITSGLCVIFALPTWGHGENRRLCSRRSAAWLRQLCSGRRNVEKRRSSAARTERRRPGSRMGQSTSSSALVKHYHWLPIHQRIQFKTACITSTSTSTPLSLLISTLFLNITLQLVHYVHLTLICCLCLVSVHVLALEVFL